MASSMGSLINFLFLEGEGCSYDSIPLEATDAPEDGEVTLEEALEEVLVEMVETLTGVVGSILSLACSGVTCSLVFNIVHLAVKSQVESIPKKLVE